jgi:hypothetical protein
MTSRILNTHDRCSLINSIGIENRPGDLKNATRKEFATLFLSHANREALLAIPEREALVIELDDGRILEFQHNHYPPTGRLPDLHEWVVELTTLKQKTPRCLRKWHTRSAWLYLAPYDEETGYKTDPSGMWSYRVWK